LNINFRKEVILLRNHRTLVANLRDELRKEVLKIPVFKESGRGAIRIMFYPESEDADYWLDGLGKYKRGSNGEPSEKGNDIVDYEWCFPAVEGGSRVIEFDYEGQHQYCDCYAYSALKIAHCCKAQTLGVGLSSGLDLEPDPDKPIYTENNGYAAHKGAIAIEVTQAKMNSFGYPMFYQFMLIYICVSGATSEEDEQVALSAIPVIEAFFKEENGDFKIKTVEPKGGKKDDNG
jgi:hypothetical protein